MDFMDFMELTEPKYVKFEENLEDDETTGTTGALSCEGLGFSILVTNCYDKPATGDQIETQYDKVRRLLTGERNLTPVFLIYGAPLEFTIDNSGQFRLVGADTKIYFDYESNKEELDKYMRFMLAGKEQ